MTNLKNLEQQKANLEYHISQMQEQLNQVLVEIEVEKKATAKTTKKAKLSPTQEKVMNSLYNAVPYYQDLTMGRKTHVGTFYKEINQYTFINGERINLKLNEEKGRMERKSHSYIMGENRYAHEMDTKTLKALERKGYIKIIETGGESMDLVELVDNITQPEIYTEFSKLEIDTSYNCGFSHKLIESTNFIYCPIGQEEQTFTTYKKELENYKTDYTNIELLSTSIVPVDTWKF